MSLGVASVALASSLDLMGSCKVGFINIPYANNASFDEQVLQIRNLGQWTNQNFTYNHCYDLLSVSVTEVAGITTLATTATGSTVGTNSSTETYSGQYNGSGISSNSTYVSGDGTYWNPNSEYLGNTYPTTISTTGSESGNWTETGYISGSGSASGSYRSTESVTGSGTGSYDGSARSVQYYVPDLTGDIDFQTYGTKTLYLYADGFVDQLAGTAVDVSGMTCRALLVQQSGYTSYQLQSYSVPRVHFKGVDNKWYVGESVDGHYISPVNFKAIAVFNSFSVSSQHGVLKEIRFPAVWHIYINYDYAQTNEIISTENNNTNNINQNIQQQTQNQTNQLKDTSGSDGILSAPQNMGNSIYEQVTFANQLAGVTTQLATTVASAEPNDASLTWPKFEFQGKTIWEEQTFSLWTYVPVEIASRLRLFNTMVIGLMWLRSLWVWISDIFDLHDDKHDPKEVVISEEVPVEAYQLDF